MLSVFLLGGFLLFAENMHTVINSIKNKVEIVAFIRPAVAIDERARLQHTISRMPNVHSVHYISEEDALKDFMKDPDIKKEIDLINTNPLPSSFHIKVYRKNFEHVSHLANALRALPELDDVIYGAKHIKHLTTVLGYIYVLGSIVGIFCFMMVVGLLMYMSKITLQYHRMAIHVMCMLGATSSFVKQLFMVEGLILGVCASVCGLLVLFGLYAFISVEVLPLVFLSPVSLTLLLCTGIVLGIISRIMLIKRCVRMR